MMTSSTHILCAGDNVSLTTLANSRLASVRLRLAPAAEAAALSGFHVTAGDNIPRGTDIVLVGKLFKDQVAERQPQWIAQLQALSTSGSSIVVDYTDHHLAFDSPLSPFYSQIMELATKVTVASHAMKLAISEQYDVPIQQVDDKSDFEPLPPKSPDLFGNTALWFGQRSNLIILSRLIQAWPEFASSKTLFVVGGPNDDDKLKEYLAGTKVKVKLQFLLWSVDMLLLAARRADMAVIPGSLSSHKQFASNNRLVTSLTLGLPTVATAIPSYEEFTDCFARFGTPESGTVFKDPAEGLPGVNRFQRHHARRFSHHAVVEAWKRVFETC